MKNNLRLASVAMVALVATGILVANADRARAEFQIQEAGIEKGQVESEYRGAYHWGVPQVTDANPNANDLVQSHEAELSYGVTNWWLLQFTTGFEQPRGEDLQASEFEVETEFALIKREGNGIALSFQGGYQRSVNSDSDEIGFGPIVELASGKLLITLNPLFTDQVGPRRDTESLGFGYGWRAEYDFAKHWGVGVEMFGQIEDLSNVGSFNQQNHSIGPTLFWNPRGGEEEEAKAGEEDKIAGPAPMELSFNVGMQFGLTHATSDSALKFQGSLAF